MGRHSVNITSVESANIAYATPSTVNTGRDFACSTSGNNCTGNTTTISVEESANMLQNSTTTPDQLLLSADRYYNFYAYDYNATETTALFFPLNGSTIAGPGRPFEKSSCQWIPAQQSLFQFSNICFLTAFIVPRSYKLSVLSLRSVARISRAKDAGRSNL